MPGDQSLGVADGQPIPRRAGQPESRGETALPDGPAIKGRKIAARPPARFLTPGKWTSHLGFGLETRLAPAARDIRFKDKLLDLTAVVDPETIVMRVEPSSLFNKCNRASMALGIL